ncbi:MAG TPA: M67 family metallopeptidase [Acidimicrobiales bacterium]|nr:M67 family metallopeptidase [Acidimicrobiales bacterium]
MLDLRESAWRAMVAHAYYGLPDEACGLLGGRRRGDDGALAEVFVPCENADRSSRTFSLGPDAWEKADRDIEGRGLEILGVVHSHTHTEAYPSPTDIEQAGNPFLVGWRWVLVSLRQPEPVVRSYLIVGDDVREEHIGLVQG